MNYIYFFIFFIVKKAQLYLWDPLLDFFFPEKLVHHWLLTLGFQSSEEIEF